MTDLVPQTPQEIMKRVRQSADVVQTLAQHTMARCPESEKHNMAAALQNVQDRIMESMFWFGQAASLLIPAEGEE